MLNDWVKGLIPRVDRLFVTGELFACLWVSNRDINYVGITTLRRDLQMLRALISNMSGNVGVIVSEPGC
jgi:hypothetical protein